MATQSQLAYPKDAGNTHRIFDIVYSKDDVNWKSVIYDLVRIEHMDPWNIDVSMLTNRYVEIIKKLKDHDFRISGKMVLAAAILLGIKSKRLVGEDLEELDRLISSSDESDYGEFYDDMDYDHVAGLIDGTPTGSNEEPVLIPRTPQPRVRNMSVYDLVNALEQALEVKKRRVLNSIPDSPVEIPERQVNISRSIKDIYRKIIEAFHAQSRVSFSSLLPDNPSRESKVYTFIPLLHLTNTRKIGLDQKDHFGDIEILLRSERIAGEDPFKDFRPDYIDEIEAQEKADAEKLKVKKAKAKSKKK